MCCMMDHGMNHAESEQTHAPSESALEILKKPIPNTVIAGASLSLLPELKLEHLLQSIAIEMADLAPEMVERNKLAAQKGYEARR